MIPPCSCQTGRQKLTPVTVVKDGHVEVANKLLQDLKRAKDTGKDRWGWKGGVQVAVGDAVFDLHKLKKD